MKRLLLVLSVIVAGACSPVAQMADSVELQRDMERRYPGSRATVKWVNGLTHLAVRLDTPQFRQIAEDSVEVRGREVARTALEFFPTRRRPDTVTVEFVVESSGRFVRFSRDASVTFATSELDEP